MKVPQVFGSSQLMNDHRQMQVCLEARAATFRGVIKIVVHVASASGATFQKGRQLNAV